MEALTKQKQDLEQIHAQLKTIKSVAEKREQEAIELHALLSHGFCRHFQFQIHQQVDTCLCQ